MDMILKRTPMASLSTWPSPANTHRCTLCLRLCRSFVHSTAKTSATRGPVHIQRCSSSTNPIDHTSISSILSKPSWSVRSLLPSADDSASTASVSQKQLHHLLRLCALPLPSSPEDERTMLRTLQSQLHFVRDIQSVDTTDVEPLRSLRDESVAAMREEEITMEDLAEAFANEERVGPSRRIKRKATEPSSETTEAEDWNVLGQAQRKVGRYFVVQTGEDQA